MQDFLVFTQDNLDNIFKRKREYEVRVQGIQNKLDHGDSTLLLLHKKILKE